MSRRTPDVQADLLRSGYGTKSHVAELLARIETLEALLDRAANLIAQQSANRFGHARIRVDMELLVLLAEIREAQS